MTTTQKFTYSWPDGVEPMTFNAWINNLPAGERLEFDLALQRQRANESAVAGLTVSESADESSNTWAGSNPTDLQMDSVWLHYHNRYLTETQTKITVTTESV